MSKGTSNDELDEILIKNMVAATRYTEEQTTNPDLPSLLTITDLDNILVNLPKLKADLRTHIQSEIDKAVVEAKNEISYLKGYIKVLTKVKEEDASS